MVLKNIFTLYIFQNRHLLLLLQLTDDSLEPLDEHLGLLGAVRGEGLVDLLRLVIEPLHLGGQLVRELQRGLRGYNSNLSFITV